MLLAAAVAAAAAFAARSGGAPAAPQAALEPSPQPAAPARSEPPPQPEPAAPAERPAPADPAAQPPTVQSPAAQPTEAQAQIAAAPEPASEPGPPPEPEPLPELEPPAAPTLRIAPDTVRQGEVAAVHAAAEWVGRAVLRSGGFSSPMILLGDTWFGLQPFPPDTPPGVQTIVVELYGADGRSRLELSGEVLVTPAGVPLEEITIGEGTGDPIDREALQRDIDVRFHQHTAVSGPPLWSGPWQRPAAGEDSGRFGALRSYNGAPAIDWHHGHDIAADHGDPVAAPAPAVVAWVGELAIHGRGVILDHGAGVYSGYWHLSLIAVEPGQRVAQGDWLGSIGVTGLTTGPHLHWELIVHGRDVDPLQWLGEQRPRLPDDG